MTLKFEPRLVRTVLAVSIAAIGMLAQPLAWAEDEEEVVDVQRLIRPDSEVELGVGYVSKDSYKFGDYRGLQREGAHLIGNVDLNRRSDDHATYLQLKARNLGLDSRSLKVEGGEVDNYSLRLEYDRIQKLYSDSYQTPFTNPGSTSLQLPVGFDRKAVTGTMTTLDDSMRPFKVDSTRDSVTLGVGKRLPAGWDADLRIKREKRDGNRFIGGVIGNSGGNPRAAILPEPINYTTDEIEALLNYTSKKLQLQFGYYGSFFDNTNTNLTWKNPFLGVGGWLGGGTYDEGQIGLAPSNEMHQISASGGYSYTKDTRVSGSLSVGRMTQNDAFLKYSVNPLLDQPLPRSSLDGRIDTVHADLKFNTKLMPKLHFSALYRYDERDNKTPQQAYQYIGGDSVGQNLGTVNAVLGRNRTNLPGSSTKQQIDAEFDYHYSADTKLKLGYGYDWAKKTFEAIKDENEHVVKAEVHQHFNDIVSGGLGYSYSDRRTSDYNALAPFAATFSQAYIDAMIITGGAWDNVPTQYKFIMAPRKRDKVRGFLNVSPNAQLDLQAGFDFKYDDYHKSQYGLQKAKGWALNLDASYKATDALSGHVFTSWDGYSSGQRSINLQAKTNLATTWDWTADNLDRTFTVGTGMRYKPLSKYEVGGDLTHAKSSGRISIWTGPSIVANSARPFPELKTSMTRLDLFGQYKLQKDMVLKLKYIYERYTSADWALDQVLPGTLANVIGTGQTSPSYNIHYVGVSLAYQF
jgi:MtrB/PioB family decaheme-associated outer membrane protein